MLVTENEGGKSVTENPENYGNIIRKFCSSLNRLQGITRNQQRFMQDGATPHTANATLELLIQQFSDRVISHKKALIHWQLILLVLKSLWLLSLRIR